MDNLNLNQQTNNIVPITAENFQHELLTVSQTKLVVINFATQRSGESINLSETLAKIATQYPQDLNLAIVDCDDPQMQQLAMQFGVQSLPTVILFKDGKGLNGFAGEQTEAQIKEFLSPYLPKPEDKLIQQVAALIQEHNFQDALLPAKEAFQIAPENALCKKQLIDVLLSLGQNTEAEALLSDIGMIDQDDYYQSLVAKLELNKEAAETPEIQALRQALNEQPDNLELNIQLAVQLHQAQQNEEALDILMAILVKDLHAQDGEVKKTLMDILATMAKGDAVATKFRRKLYSLLY
ncbi:tetratricopeptide repeat protein [Catenovulum sp. 2E275]|uniref:tetratricopeptide repeat protein n=1 Tax=Catenovulum sp. 2E275 TaxID=2980497 RepID=UPI0021D35033|nr:tetratricopeptide repeat protein [Catenovulum sp. 2E275]MCU4675514.1 tetratricopeptide repeat protein [Catenovulum sp. 2E275]